MKSTNLGFPRMGLERELKRSLEDFWKGNSDETALENKAKELVSVLLQSNGIYGQ